MNAQPPRSPATPPSVDEIFARARPILAEIRASAPAREAARLLPHAEIRQLAAAGLTSVRVPRDYGGPGLTLRQAFQLVIDIAAADSNIAQGLRSHFLHVEGTRLKSDEGLRQKWFTRYLQGDIVGLARGEIGVANGVHLTRITPEGADFRINGRKFYTTGTLFSQWVNITARDPEDRAEYSVVVPTRREGVEVLDDWDGFGQRMTASGTTVLNNVLAHPDEVAHVDLSAPRSSPGIGQLVLAAAQAGIARNAYLDALDYARTKARSIKHALTASPVENPLIQRTVGELASRAFVSEQIVLATAQLVEEALQTPAATRQDAIIAATVQLAQAQIYTTENAMRSAELLFDVAGASATKRGYNFDRHWRNARTLASHNPMDAKAQTIGAHLLTGSDLPRNFF